MIYLFAILLTTNNTVIHGSELDGWGPRLQPDMATCERRARASYAPPNGVKRVFFYCEVVE